MLSEPYETSNKKRKDFKVFTTILIMLLNTAVCVSLISFGFYLSQKAQTRTLARGMIESGCVPALPDLKD